MSFAPSNPAFVLLAITALSLAPAVWIGQQGLRRPARSVPADPYLFPTRQPPASALRRASRARDAAANRSSACALQRSGGGGRSIPSGSTAARIFSMRSMRHD
jgi:hypothetical protein